MKSKFQIRLGLNGANTHIVAKIVVVVFSLADENAFMEISETKDVVEKLNKKMIFNVTPKNVLTGPLGNPGASVILHVVVDLEHAIG